MVHITCLDHVSLLQDQHYKPFTAMLIKICSPSLSITPPEDDPMLKARMNNHEWSRNRKTMKLTSKIFAPRLHIKWLNVLSKAPILKWNCTIYKTKERICTLNWQLSQAANKGNLWHRPMRRIIMKYLTRLKYTENILKKISF